jgi:uncharacterized protein YwqG
MNWNELVTKLKAFNRNPRPMNWNELTKKLQAFKRTAYLPIVEKVEPSFSADSKLGGLPYLDNKDDWPVCPNCKKHMTFFLQLDLAALPERKQEGLLQFFSCTSWDEPNCQMDLSNYEAFSKGTVVRIATPNKTSIQIEHTAHNSFPEKRITSWESFSDYPDTEDYDRLGIVPDGFHSLPEDISDRIYGENYLPKGVDKLFGWPHWVQCAEYPFDRQTKERMELIFQLASKNNVPYMWGDAGIGHITQSPSNRNELGWGWACS